MHKKTGGEILDLSLTSHLGRLSQKAKVVFSTLRWEKHIWGCGMRSSVPDNRNGISVIRRR